MTKLLLPSSLGAFAAAVLGVGALVSLASAAQNTHGTWKDYSQNSCSNATACSKAGATPVPVGKTLVLRNLSCRLKTGQNIAVTALILSGSNAGDWIPVGPPQLTTASGREHYINIELFAPFAAGTKPSVMLQTRVPGQMSFNCTYSGELRP